MALSSVLLAFLALSTSLLAHAEVLSLSDLKWTLKNQNGSIAIPAEVPSQAHLDLLRAGIITEPLLGINGMVPVWFLFHVHLLSVDFTQRWIVDDNWTYTADLTPVLSRKENSEKNVLVFYGLDTVANIVHIGVPLVKSLSN